MRPRSALVWLAVAIAASASGVAASPPAASPPPPAPSAGPSWADWVGDWDGKLRWSGCTIDGASAATLSIDAIDGALSIDLTPAGGALSTMPLAADAPGSAADPRVGWSGRVDDVAVRVTRGAASLDVAVDLDSGCAMRGSLHRAGVGIAACDDLVAWARIEGRCTKLVRPALEDFARVVHQRAEWMKSPPDARAHVAELCRARASKVEAELGAVGCAPDPAAAQPRFPECAALALAAAKITRCQTVAFDVATMLAHEAHELSVATQLASSDRAHTIVESQCRDMRAQITATAQQAGCAP